MCLLTANPGQAQGELARGVHVPDSTSATVAEAAAGWLDRCTTDGLERATLANYKQHLRLHILPLIGREKLSRLTLPFVESLKDELLKTRSRVLTKKVLGSLKSLLKDAQRRGLVVQNVAAAVRVGSSSRHQHRAELGRDIPPTAEIRALLVAAASSLRWRAFITTAVFTACARASSAALTWSHVDFEAKVVRVRQRADRWGVIGSPKSKGSRRDVPLSPLVLNTLREWKLSCPKSLSGPKPRDKGRLGRLSDPTGHDANEACAGLESDDADAAPPEFRGRSECGAAPRP